MCDFGHLLELQLDSALVKCPDASDIVSAVNDVVRDLANSWYKAYAEECKVQDIRFLQPSALKRLKFVKRVEAQFTKFIKMFQAIHVVAQKQLVQLRHRGSDDPEENLDSVELREGESEGQYNRHPITAGRPKSIPLGRKHKIVEFLAPDCLFRTTDLANMRTHTNVVHLKL